MSLPIILRPKAVLDVDSTRIHYESIRVGLGQKFLDEVHQKLSRIGQMPEVHAIVWRNVRATLVHRFPYVIYYRILKDEVEVLAVIHGSRDEEAWKDRV